MEIVVVPLAGTWIETVQDFISVITPRVVPLAGTWIETESTADGGREKRVVPLAGTWIETLCSECLLRVGRGRSPCGNVD